MLNNILILLLLFWISEFYDDPALMRGPAQPSPIRAIELQIGLVPYGLQAFLPWPHITTTRRVRDFEAPPFAAASSASPQPPASAFHPDAILMDAVRVMTTKNLSRIERSNWASGGKELWDRSLSGWLFVLPLLRSASSTRPKVWCFYYVVLYWCLVCGTSWDGDNCISDLENVKKGNSAGELCLHILTHQFIVSRNVI